MKRPDYVPKSHDGLKTWQNTINTMVSDNANNWGIDAAVVARLNADSATFALLFQKIDNRNVRTLQQVAEFNQFRVAYVAFLRQLVQGYLINNPLVSYSEKIAMNLNPRTGGYTRRTKIGPTPNILIHSRGNGMMEFVCTDSTANRAALPDNADGVELHISVNMGPQAGTATGTDAEPAKVEVVQHFTVSSSRSRVSHQFTDAQRGKTFTVRGRYYNNTNRANDSSMGSSSSDIVS